IAQLRERLAATELAGQTAAENYRRELDQAHADAKTMRNELDAVRRDTTARIETLQGKMAEHKAQMEAATQKHADYRARAEQDTAHLQESLEQSKAALEVARNEVAGAREAAAKLEGQLEAVQAQNATLLATIQQK
ncbi:kfra protein, partial [Aeromonas hydrophila]|nr:kfra protein [Aeromonas hydrophila]